MTEHFTTVAAMIDDLRSSESEKRLTSMKALTIIAQTLGPERTRSELLPYITEYLDEDDDVLRAMATVLGQLVEEVGGKPYIGTLLSPLEIVSGLDEVTVRDAAVASMNAIATKIFTSPPAPGGASSGGASDPQQLFIASVQRLGESEHVHSRCSACGILACPYRYSTSTVSKRDLRALFTKLCDDPEISVRRSACVALAANFAPLWTNDASSSSSAAPSPALAAEFLPSFLKFCKDTNDSVRVQAIPVAVSFLPLVPESSIGQIMTALKVLCSDSVWRVRYMLADRLSAVAQGIRRGGASSSAASDAHFKTLMTIYSTLLNDAEPEIRAAAVFGTDIICSPATGMNDDSRKECLNQACRLTQDSIPHVRSSLAAIILKCGGGNGSSSSIVADLYRSYIVPTATSLLNDSDNTVRLAILSGFNALNDTTVPDLHAVAPTLLPIVVSLAKDTNWRARENVVKQIPSIVRAVGWSEELLSVILSAMTDRVATIRACAGQSCVRLVEKEGITWSRQALLPRLKETLNANQYIYRVSLCHALTSLLELPMVDTPFVKEDLWPMIKVLSQDSVPNVRLNAARFIKWAIQVRKLQSNGEVEQVLAALQKDTDTDVRDVVVYGAAQSASAFLAHGNGGTGAAVGMLMNPVKSGNNSSNGRPQ